MQLHPKGVFKWPLPGPIIMRFNVHKYLTDGIVQDAWSAAVFTLQMCLDLLHGFFGHFEFGIIKDICGVTGLERNGRSVLNCTFFSTTLVKLLNERVNMIAQYARLKSHNST